jgi:hypothetical protein
MATTLTLTQAATVAAQEIGVLDSGESLSTQQLADALVIANDLLASWYRAQVNTLDVLITEQTKTISVLVTAFLLSAGTYTPGIFAPSAEPAFPDTTTPITLPDGYDRTLKLALAVDMAPQYDMTVSKELLASLQEAKAAVNLKPAGSPTPTPA